mmetsp:Transcript_3930/g.6015  ORF Transcript_3930/g.6015 Transcript_3930/m.6015 type:complete len:282 (-) Transcript_3930:491-1336(-)
MNTIVTASTDKEGSGHRAGGTLLQVLQSAMLVDDMISLSSSSAPMKRGAVSNQDERSETKKRKKQERRGRPANEAFRAMHYTGRVSSTIHLIASHQINDFPNGNAPAYTQIINHPRQSKKKDVSSRRCVMCGRISIQKHQQQHLHPHDSIDPLHAVIPMQNKDVCRECDRASWIHHSTGMVIKWCKGCKRFENILKFQGSIFASKCDSCRERGRIGYFERVARKKKEGEDNDTTPLINNQQPLNKNMNHFHSLHQKGGLTTTTTTTTTEGEQQEKEVTTTV